MANSFEKVQKIVADKLKVDLSKVTMDSYFLQDLGADSLDTYDLVYLIEEEFGVTVPDDKLSHIETVGDVVKALDELLD